MKLVARTAPLVWLALYATSGACVAVTELGGACANRSCPSRGSCKQAEQQLPRTCDLNAGTCNGAIIPDAEQACVDCSLTNEMLGIKNTAMAACACEHCAVQLAACLDSDMRETAGNRDRDNLCRTIVECGWANQCSGSECFCGKGVDRVTCLEQANAGPAQGPCAEVIIHAAACDTAESVGNCVLAAQLEPETALFRASQVAFCVTGDPLMSTEGIEPKCSRDLYLVK